MNTLIKPPCCNPYSVSNKNIVTTIGNNSEQNQYICIFPSYICKNEVAAKYVLMNAKGERKVCSYNQLLKLMSENKLTVNNLAVGMNRSLNIHTVKINGTTYSGDMIKWLIHNQTEQLDFVLNKEQLLSDFKQGLKCSIYAEEELSEYGNYKMILDCQEIDASKIKTDSLYVDLCKKFDTTYSNIDTNKATYRLRYIRTDWDCSLGITIYIAYIKNSSKLYVFIDDCDIDGACATDYFVSDYKSLRAILQNGEFYATDYACKLGANIRTVFR